MPVFLIFYLVPAASWWQCAALLAVVVIGTHCRNRTAEQVLRTAQSTLASRQFPARARFRTTQHKGVRLNVTIPKPDIEDSGAPTPEVSNPAKNRAPAAKFDKEMPRFYQENIEWLLARLRRYFPDVDYRSREDAIHEAIINCRTIPNLAKPASRKYYILTTAKNILKAKCKEDGVFCHEDPVTYLQNLGANRCDPQDVIPVLRMLVQLPTQQREVLYRWAYEDMKMKDIASAMNISVSTAQTHKKRGLRTLRQSLTEKDRTGNLSGGRQDSSRRSR